MDPRHIFLLHDVLMSWPFLSALEIGSFHGASATAFVEAINSGAGLGISGIATFCDVNVTDSLISVVNSCRHPARVRVTPQPSWTVLGSQLPFDFIFVDGSHDAESVGREITHLMRRMPRCVMAHDTNATDAGWAKAEGARQLKETFEDCPEYMCIEDSQRRSGELTHRGLFLATTDADLYAHARKSFARFGSISAAAITHCPAG